MSTLRNVFKKIAKVKTSALIGGFVGGVVGGAIGTVLAGPAGGATLGKLGAAFGGKAGALAGGGSIVGAIIPGAEHLSGLEHAGSVVDVVTSNTDVFNHAASATAETVTQTLDPSNVVDAVKETPHFISDYVPPEVDYRHKLDWNNSLKVNPHVLGMTEQIADTTGVDPNTSSSVLAQSFEPAHSNLSAFADGVDVHGNPGGRDGWGAPPHDPYGNPAGRDVWGGKPKPTGLGFFCSAV